MNRSRQIILAATIGFIAVGVYFATAPRRGADRGPAILDDPWMKLKSSFQRPQEIPYPPSNPFSEAKYQLGKMLFFDPRLSRSGAMSCATCHNPSFSWYDGRGRGVGHGHRELGRKVPTLLNGAWGLSFFWDGRAETLEEQSFGPIESPLEMNLPAAEAVARLGAIGGYRQAFAEAFPGEALSKETIAKAIATFERGIVSDLAPFDYWVAGREDAISPSAKRGALVFQDKGRCVLCHTGWRFTNDSFADIGLATADTGRGKITGSRWLQFGFKTPTLRNITRRAPYMHDGSLATLRDVVDNYDRGGTAKRETSKIFLKPLALSAEEKEDLISFLTTLESDDEAISIPRLPPDDRKEAPWRTVSSTR